MELQAIFNKAHSHFKTMGEPSMTSLDNDADNASASSSSCSYRGSGGAMCAVGVFIEDQYYSDSLEGNAILSTNGSDLDINVQKAVAYSFKQGRLSDEQLNLLCALQRVHDDNSEDLWCGTFLLAYEDDTTAWYKICEDKLRAVAAKFNLKFN